MDSSFRILLCESLGTLWTTVQTQQPHYPLEKIVELIITIGDVDDPSVDEAIVRVFSRIDTRSIKETDVDPSSIKALFSRFDSRSEILVPDQLRVVPFLALLSCGNAKVLVDSGMFAKCLDCIDSEAKAVPEIAWKALSATLTKGKALLNQTMLPSDTLARVVAGIDTATRPTDPLKLSQEQQSVLGTLLLINLHPDDGKLLGYEVLSRVRGVMDQDVSPVAKQVILGHLLQTTWGAWSKIDWKNTSMIDIETVLQFVDYLPSSGDSCKSGWIVRMLGRLVNSNESNVDKLLGTKNWDKLRKAFLGSAINDSTVSVAVNTIDTILCRQPNECGSAELARIVSSYISIQLSNETLSVLNRILVCLVERNPANKQVLIVCVKGARSLLSIATQTDSSVDKECANNILKLVDLLADNQDAGSDTHQTLVAPVMKLSQRFIRTADVSKMAVVTLSKLPTASSLSWKDHLSCGKLLLDVITYHDNDTELRQQAFHLFQSLLETTSKRDALLKIWEHRVMIDLDSACSGNVNEYKVVGCVDASMELSFRSIEKDLSNMHDFGSVERGLDELIGKEEWTLWSVETILKRTIPSLVVNTNVIWNEGISSRLLKVLDQTHGILYEICAQELVNSASRWVRKYWRHGYNRDSDCPQLKMLVRLEELRPNVPLPEKTRQALQGIGKHPLSKEDQRLYRKLLETS